MIYLWRSSFEKGLLAQVKVNAILASELEKEKNNDAEMSKVNFLAFVKYKDV